MESTRDWVAFVAARGERAALAVPAGGLVERFRVDEVRAARGEKIAIDGGWWMARVESPQPIPPLFWDRRLEGVTGHLGYTDAASKAELAAISVGERQPLGVLIPIRKSAAWWSMAQDERQAHFTPAKGHTAIGMKFADRIYRKLYHARDLPGSPWDFLTWFEFESAHADDFRALLAALRDPAQNPEWEFVERESEIWLTRA